MVPFLFGIKLCVDEFFAGDHGTVGAQGAEGHFDDLVHQERVVIRAHFDIIRREAVHFSVFFFCLKKHRKIDSLMR